MLDNLVESKSNAENSTRRGGYLLTTSVLVFSLFASGLLWSLFAKDLNMGSDSMELSSMVSPVQMPENEPLPPEEVREVKQNTSVKQESNIPQRQINMASTSEPIPPKDISSAPVGVKSRPNTIFTIGEKDSDPTGGTSNTVGERTIGPTQLIKTSPKEIEKTEADEPPPIIKKKEEPKPEPTIAKTPLPTVRSSTVLNGKATSLPKPPYPAPAKIVRAGGDVNVQVTIDEKGNVVSASAVSGHPLLRQVSEQAARNAKFSPTLLGGQPVKVTGLIVYKFAIQ